MNLLQLTYNLYLLNNIQVLTQRKEVDTFISISKDWEVEKEQVNM